MKRGNKTSKKVFTRIALSCLVFCFVSSLFFTIKSYETKASSFNLGAGEYLDPATLDSYLAGGYVFVQDPKGNWIAERSVTGDITNWAKQFFTTEYYKEIWDKAGSQALQSAISSALNQIAYDTANWIATGKEGQKPLFLTEGIGEYLKNIGDNAAGRFLETLGRENYFKFNLCQPSSSFVDMKIRLGLKEYKKPSPPACTFSKMRENWDAALQSDSFLSDFQNMFEPTSNDLGIALSLQLGLIEQIDLAEKTGLEEIKLNKGWLSVEGIISGWKKYPPNEEERRLEQVRALQEGNLLKYTGSAITDAINVFVNQLAIALFNRLMERDYDSITSPYGGDYGLSDYEAGPSYGGIKAAKERFRKLIEPDFSIRGDYEILAELAMCNKSKEVKGPTECVIDKNFSQAIENKKTVGEAMKEGLLFNNGIFGFISKGLEPDIIEQSGYPYRSMIILRKFRIIPVGWELAAQHINDNQEETGVCNLGDLVACYSENDEYSNSDSACNPGAWCRNLVDPSWVLKAPLNYCKREGPGPEILFEQTVGEGASSELVISRNDNYCADEQSCIKENSNGSCEMYGYCTEERRKWNFKGESCEPKFNTCQTFRATNGSTVSYLENTLDYCSSDQTGCQAYCNDYDYENNKWCGEADSDKLYFNDKAESCDEDSEGCHEFIRTKPGAGANLLKNSSFEDFTVLGILADYDYWGEIGIAVEDISYDGTNSLHLSTDAPEGLKPPGTGVTIDAISYQVSGEKFTLSFYYRSKDENQCQIKYGLGDLDASFGNWGFTDNCIEAGDGWKYCEISYTYLEIELSNKINFQVVEDIDVAPLNNCIVDAVKLERGDIATIYGDYREQGLVYENLLPNYLEEACYKGGGDYTFKENAPGICNNYARMCNVDEADCELYTSTTDGFSIPAKVTAWDYCDEECLGYNTYIQSQTNFDSLRAEYFIPSTARTCSANAVGCDEFTNLDEVESGGEEKEYFTNLRQCIKPNGTSCADFYTWEGSDETGFQLKVFSLQKDGDEPIVTNETYDNNNCSSEIYKNGNNPDCREFYNKQGIASYHLYTLTISCSNDCHPFRRTEKNISLSIDPGACQNIGIGGDCSLPESEEHGMCWDYEADACYYCQNRGKWSVNHQACIYSAIPGEGIACSASQNGCREYKGDKSGNIYQVFDKPSDFESGTADGWEKAPGSDYQKTTFENSNTAAKVGTYSLKVWHEGYEIKIVKPINNDEIKKDEIYELNFWVKQSDDPGIKVYFDDLAGKKSNNFIGGIIKISDDWYNYSFKIALNNFTPKETEYIAIEANDTNYEEEIYFDQIVLSQIDDKYNLIKDSWITPDVCNQDIEYNPYPLFDLGCDQYQDRDNNTHFLHSFSQLCQESAVGCELMIDTHNYIDYEKGIWNDDGNDANPGDANNGVCDASEPDCIEVEADNYTYVVYNEDNLCYKEDKGCQRLGDPYQYGSQVIYGDIFLENNPDNYASLCNEDGIGCEKWKTNEGDSNFKDPGDMVCEWRQGYQDKIGWWKEKIKRCDDGGVGTEKGIIDFGIENNVCLTDADCGETPIGECTIDSNCSEFEKCVDSKCHYACIQDTNDYACDTDDLKTIGYGGVSNKIEQPKKDDIGNYWAGLCSADQAGCTEYIDPISKFNTNIIFNADFSQDSDGASPADGWSGGNQEVILEPNSLYILALEGNDLINLTATNPVFRELSNINNFSNPSTDVFIDSTGGRKSKIFYTTSGASAKLSAGTTSQNNGNKIELKKAIVDYQLRQELTVPENSNVNFKEGQILFNERKISGAGGYVKLNRDADTSPIVSGTWAECIDNPENCDSNSLYQVTPDRACNEWLACRSYIKDENDNNVCFDIGLCDRMDDNGACDSFVIEDKVNQTYDTYVQDISNLSGYSKVGYKNSQSNSFIPPNDQYLLGEMEQKGEVAKLPNGNFEVAGTNGYPIGWVYEGGSGITQSVFPPDYPGAATTTSLSWNTNVFKVINNPFETQEECLNPNCSTYVPEGRNFLRLGSTFNATSEFIEVEPNALYVITAHINTLNLAEGEVRVKIFNTDGGEIEVKPAIKLNLGNKWTFKLGKFNTNNSSQIKVRLMAEGSEEDPNGKFYFDDIKIRPALEIKDLTPPPSSDDTEFWHTPQSCRLYPEDDSLSCDYYDDSGLRQKGWLGYCLEYDRSPGSPDACLLWYPVDKVKGDGIEEGAGYNDKLPVYICLEAESYCGGEDNLTPISMCNKIVRVVSPTGQNKYWAGRAEGSQWEIPFADSTDGKYIDWGVNNGGKDNVILSYERDGQPFGSMIPPYPANNPYEWDSQPNTGGDTLNQPVYVFHAGSSEGGIRAGTPYSGTGIECMENYGEQQCNCGTCDTHNYGYWDYCKKGDHDTASDGSCNINQKADGTWEMNICDGCKNKDCDTCDALCYNKIKYNMASSIDEAINGVKTIFAQSYGNWKWSVANNRYEECNGTNCDLVEWGPPEDKCDGVPPQRPDSMGFCPGPECGYCAIPPTIDNIRVNNYDGDITIGKNQFVNLTFNTDIDNEQLPMVMYTIDWGDNEKTAVTGVEMRDRPDPDPANPDNNGNPHSLYHLYSYWDLKAKQVVDQSPDENSVYCGNAGDPAINKTGDPATNKNGALAPNCGSSACCKFKPKIKIKDNWGWCNGGETINDCNNSYNWEEFGGWVTVEEK